MNQIISYLHSYIKSINSIFYLIRKRFIVLLYIIYQQSRIISGLMENEVYVFAVTAFNQVGESMVNVSIMARTNGSRELLK